MTSVYFVRHAQADGSMRDNRMRPLTEKGLRDCALVTGYLADKNISRIVSSPYRRALDTLRDFARSAGLPIACEEAFAERRIAGEWIEDYQAYARRQWADFDYKLPGGECLREVQARGVAALNRLVASHPGENIAVGTHGTALSAIIRFYDEGFGYDSFLEIVGRTPWIVRFSFNGRDCAGVEPVDLF